ncbi:MAG: hypothetical protein KY410_09350 [Proteobacteria bacterium]|nr:hypothetical protein [Pseudomonadota bacterium]
MLYQHLASLQDHDVVLERDAHGKPVTNVPSVIRHYCNGQFDWSYRSWQSLELALNILHWWIPSELDMGGTVWLTSASVSRKVFDVHRDFAVDFLIRMPYAGGVISVRNVHAWLMDRVVFGGMRHVGQDTGGRPGPGDVIAEIVELHHYRLDGSGYPARLSPPPGQHVMVVAICDAFEAMTAYRSYKDPLAPEEALIEMDRLSRRQFPAELVQQFIAYLGIYPRGNFVLLENGAMGVVVSCDPNHKTRPVIRMVRGPAGQDMMDEYLDLSRLDRTAHLHGWRIVRSTHPARLGRNPA